MSSQDFEGFQDLEDEVAAYAAEVRAQLVDLPPADSAELLEDLEDHLREVAAEDVGALRERLGAPATYARELRQAAGLPGPGEARAAAASAPGGWRVLTRAVRHGLADRGRRVERRVRSTEAGRQVLDFLPSLTPAWWVFRAWVLVRVLEVLTGNVNLWQDFAVIPRVGESRLVGLVALLLAIPASVYVGRYGLGDGWRRRLLIAGETVLGIFAFTILVSGAVSANDHSGSQPYANYAYSPQGYYSSADLNENGGPITNLFVYDKDGKLLDGVYIYNQDGQPVNVARPGETFGGNIDGGAWVDGSGQLVTNRYPKQLMSAQWSATDNTAHYVTIPPPNVAPPKGVHLSGQPTPQDSATPSGGTSPTTPGASPTSSASPTTAQSTQSPQSTHSAQSTQTPAPSTPATPATSTPTSATPAQSSPPPSTLR
ncbi:hypothetical protein GCM10009839_93630 [Catenulispora yoronensis]|uniref:Uncharacterized protein n=1 Tax=Catenulispora yoronensis TaxID=450799 RepID=A0ABN2VN91_9ACTN